MDTETLEAEIVSKFPGMKFHPALPCFLSAHSRVGLTSGDVLAGFQLFMDGWNAAHAAAHKKFLADKFASK